MSRSMPCVVTGAPFSMLAEFPMMMASSFALRSALARAISVFSEKSEDIATVLAASEEHGPAPRRQQEAADDQPQVARIQLRKLRREAQAGVLDLAREQVHVTRPSAARAVEACRCTFDRALAAPTQPAHVSCVHAKRQ